jgi:hypothetical protein
LYDTVSLDYNNVIIHHDVFSLASIGVELDLDAKKGVITLRPKDEAAR